MSKHLMLFIIGAFVAVLPFLGFPSEWDRIFLTSSGVLVSLAAVIIRFEIRRLSGASKEDNLAFGPVFIDSAGSKRDINQAGD